MPSPEDNNIEDHDMENNGDLPDTKMADVPTVSKEELNEIIEAVGNAPLKENDTWFIISSKWWNKFIEAVKNGYIDDIGEIDNSEISEKSRKGEYFLKNKLIESVDFQTIPESVFKRLTELFKMEDDSRDYIPRQVVKKNNQLVVEVYPRVVHISNARNRNFKVDLTLKPNDTMETLRERAIAELDLKQTDNVRFYVMNGDNPELVDTTQSLDSYFDTAQNVVIDIEENGEFFYKNKSTTQPQSKSLYNETSSNDSDESSTCDDESPLRRFTIKSNRHLLSKNRNRRFSTTTCTSIGSKLIWPFVTFWWHLRDFWWRFSLIWPNEVRSLFAFFFGWRILLPPPRIGNGSYNQNLSFSGQISKVQPGQCGLGNLGNTCFMASALQCLSNMPPLREYFLSGAYMNDLNVNNPLGTSGNLAIAIGELFKAMWSGNCSSMNPRKVKGVIGQFAPRFNGYSQQDAHELMAYVLDGLHEDLNRIKKKPYFEDNDELAKLPLHEYAEESWKVYKMRNDSIIVDTLHGQLKSTLICPVCAKISIKFDPFGYLSLPLPPKEVLTKHTVTVMFLQSKWAKFVIGVTNQTTIADVHSMIFNKLQRTLPHLVFFYLSGSASSEVALLRSTDRILLGGDRETYVAEVDHDPLQEGVKIIVAQNHYKLTKPCTLPMIYTIKSKHDFTRSFIMNTILRTTKHFFFNEKNMENGGDVSMNGVETEIEPFSLHLYRSRQSSEPIVFPPSNEPIEWVDNVVGDAYDTYQQIVFMWKDSKIFNLNLRSKDLVEREMQVQTRRKVELMETLDWFTTKEQLGEQDLWYCPECKKHERATKQLDLWRLPEILILHLKRFQYTRWSREKLAWEVVIPVKGLDLTSKVVNEKHEKAVYDLIAVSKHYGSLNGGHYTAMAYNDKCKKWFTFDDGSAFFTAAPTDPYEASDPYMLVYKRRRLDANGEPIESSLEDGYFVDQKYNNNKRNTLHFDENVEMEMEED